MSVELKRRFVLISALCVVLVHCPPISRCQDSATITGRVVDPSKAAIPNAIVTVLKVDTQLVSTAATNEEGLFTVSGLAPGNYRIEVAKIGFKTVIKPDVILHLQDVIAINFNMIVGSLSESVTVEGGASMLNTTDGSVSTVVDRSYIDNMPLNGRSFQDLILLTPGVVTSSPQPGFNTTAGIGLSGEFSVNGQRTESNYYTVDGASANTGINPGSLLSPSNGGSLPASTVLGTTQGLVSSDALEEFRVESSTYSAEYGRNPGGQFSFATRSGTNQWHGSAFDYIRNDVFDANNWFNNYLNTPKSPLRQNDFGGTFGGPIPVPHSYSGKGKTFFFFSYEGLRLLQPQAATISYVPDANLRQNTPPPLQAVMNAFPTANGPDLGNGLAEFIGTWSNPSRIDSYSVRLDHAINQRLKVFFRFQDTPSTQTARSGGFFSTPSSPVSSAFTTRTYTFGSTASFQRQVSNELRLNYTSNEASISGLVDNFGGAQPVDLAKLQGLSIGESSAYQVEVPLLFDGYFPAVSQFRVLGKQRQWNLVDTTNILLGRHQLKVGFDYRRLAPIQKPTAVSVFYEFQSASSVEANNVDAAFAQSQAAAYPLYTNFSAFAQDGWRIKRSLNVSLGLRWEVNPAPGATRGNLPYTVDGTNPSSLALAPQGTPLWQTSWHNFAPRLSVAYVLPGSTGYETVFRGGVGIFYDTGQQLGSLGYNGPGFQSSAFYGPPGPAVSFPLSPAQAEPPIINPPQPPYSQVYAYPAHLQLPLTWQWNASIEQSLTSAQKVTISYVGANGRKLLEQNRLSLGPLNPNFDLVYFIQNGHTSDYNALQVQFQRRLTQGLVALAAYTWSHGIDYGSQNADLEYVRGNSSLDVRHNLSAAFSYDLPSRFHGGFLGVVLNHWGMDSRFSARTSFPVTLNGFLYTDPSSGKQYPGGLDLVPNQPLYVYNRDYPGGRAINGKAFAPVAFGAIGNAPRNLARGFGAWQMDFSARREFPVYDRLRLQFRAEAFNLFNHPNFGSINSRYCPPGPFCTFGQATATLAQSIGVLSPLYQMGGPRSMQLALKFIF